MDEAGLSPLGALKPCLLAAGGAGIIALAAARAWFPMPSVYWGILAGWLLAAVNYVSLLKIIAKMLKPGRGKLLMGALLGVKMLGVLFAVFLVLKYFPIDAMALAAGYLAALMGAVGLHFFRSLSTVAS
jgi:hypothetical protein